MANFVTPRTWNVSELVTKAMLDEQIRDNMNAIWVGTAAGDIDYYSAANAKARLAKPAAVSILQHNGTVPSWLNKGNAYEFLRTNSGANGLEFAPLLARAVVNRNATLTITSGGVNIAWNSETSDDNNWHDNAVNPEQIKPGVAGDYIATAMVHCIGASTDIVRVLIKVNNTTLVGAQRVNGGSGFEQYVTAVSYVVTLTNTDYFNVVADNNGGNTTMQTDSFFQVLRVR